MLKITGRINIIGHKCSVPKITSIPRKLEVVDPNSIESATRMDFF